MHRYKENYCDACRRNNVPYIDAYVRITVIKVLLKSRMTAALYSGDMDAYSMCIWGIWGAQMCIEGNRGRIRGV